jgi:high-affinity iron transporter
LLPSILLSLREGIEATLVIGVVSGALKKMQRLDLRKALWAGAAAAALLSLVIALGLTALGASLEGPAEPIFEGVMMLIAAAVLTWMIVWMAGHARNRRAELEADVLVAAHKNGSKAIFLLAFFAVLREGIELALFLTAASLAAGKGDVLAGALLGLGAAALLGWGLFASLLKLDLRRFFQVTSILLVLFAAGLVARGVHEFNEVGLIPSVIEHVWDFNPVLNESSIVGQVLSALFGYNGNPSLTEVLAYFAYFGIILLSQRRQQAPAPASG